MTERIARASGRHPWRVLVIWIVVVVASVGTIVTFLESALEGEIAITSETESKRAEALLAEGFPPPPPEQDITEVVVVRSEGGSVDDAPFERRVRRLEDELREAGATNVISFYAGGNEQLVSADRDATELLVGLGADPDEETVKPLVALVQTLDDEPGIEAAITGEWTSDADFAQLSQDDLRTGELYFGGPAALIILLLVFGAVVAGLVPLALAIVSIFGALALTALVGQVFPLSVFTINMLITMGLALGIDYSLFVLSRFREERAAGREKLDAIAAAGSTASRAVLFSGIAFVLAMVGLLLVPSTIMRSLAAGAILVGIVAIVAALTLLPAVLSLLGDRVNGLKLPFFGRAAVGQTGGESRFWSRIVRAVMRRPVLSLALGVGLLVAAAVPVLNLDTGSAGPSTFPDRFESKQGHLLLNEEFPSGGVEPVEIAVAGDVASSEVRAAIDRLEADIGRQPIFGEPAVESNVAGGVTRITLPIGGDAGAEQATNAVRDLRADVVPQSFAEIDAEVAVGGPTAEEIDYQDTMERWLPRIFVFVLGISFILLTIAFRSIVVAASAIVMNLLSVGAAYGLLVLVFIEGIGNELLGFQQAAAVEAWVPLFLFAVLFGLSMDYQVFLLSRIRERYSRNGDNDEAIAFGVGSTARLITGAALIIIAVFWGFARGDLIMFQQMGFGVAVALLIDATIVRSVLVPASMKLLGERNWYLPSWLQWLPDVNVEGAEPPAGKPQRRVNT
ncbi:MAG: MMPL family transporter [Actinobacteria bacterium]|nr:MMPL family transporter [Actinomycetota bacterium]